MVHMHASPACGPPNLIHVYRASKFHQNYPISCDVTEFKNPKPRQALSKLKSQTQKPESKARVKSQSQKPDSKARFKSQTQKPDSKVRPKSQSQKPESKARLKSQIQKSDSKARFKSQAQKPEDIQELGQTITASHATPVIDWD